MVVSGWWLVISGWWLTVSGWWLAVSGWVCVVCAGGKVLPGLWEALLSGRVEAEQRNDNGGNVLFWFVFMRRACLHTGMNANSQAPLKHCWATVLYGQSISPSLFLSSPLCLSLSFFLSRYLSPCLSLPHSLCLPPSISLTHSHSHVVSVPNSLLCLGLFSFTLSLSSSYF